MMSQEAVMVSLVGVEGGDVAAGFFDDLEASHQILVPAQTAARSDSYFHLLIDAAKKEIINVKTIYYTAKRKEKRNGKQ